MASKYPSKWLNQAAQNRPIISSVPHNHTALVVFRRRPSLPPNLHGKEGVNGSSSLEAFGGNGLQMRGFRHRSNQLALSAASIWRPAYPAPSSPTCPSGGVARRCEGRPGVRDGRLSTGAGHRRQRSEGNRARSRSFGTGLSGRLGADAASSYAPRQPFRGQDVAKRPNLREHFALAAPHVDERRPAG
jgi:hypothetical protein